MKQTAVDWLIDWMGKNQYFIGNDLLHAYKQSKEMEKQQIIDARENGIYVSNKGYGISHEQYYSETYGTQD